MSVNLVNTVNLVRLAFIGDGPGFNRRLPIGFFPRMFFCHCRQNEKNFALIAIFFGTSRRFISICLMRREWFFSLWPGFPPLWIHGRFFQWRRYEM